MVEKSNDGLDVSFERKAIGKMLREHITYNPSLSIFEVIVNPRVFSISPSLIIFFHQMQKCAGTLDFSDRWKGDYLFMSAFSCTCI